MAETKRACKHCGLLFSEALIGVCIACGGEETCIFCMIEYTNRYGGATRICPSPDCATKATELGYARYSA